MSYVSDLQFTGRELLLSTGRTGGAFLLLKKEGFSSLQTLLHLKLNTEAIKVSSSDAECVKLATKIPEIVQIRFKSSKNDGCCKTCPPSYHCVQPPLEPQDEEITLPPLLQNKGKHDYRPWRNIFYFICLPLIIGMYINCFHIVNEKKKRPKFVDYSYLRIRKKPFPWGEKTLFHNPRYNALPSGYEYEVPEDEEIDP